MAAVWFDAGRDWVQRVMAGLAAPGGLALGLFGLPGAGPFLTADMLYTDLPFLADVGYSPWATVPADWVPVGVAVYQAGPHNFHFGPYSPPPYPSKVTGWCVYDPVALVALFAELFALEYDPPLTASVLPVTVSWLNVQA